MFFTIFFICLNFHVLKKSMLKKPKFYHFLTLLKKLYVNCFFKVSNFLYKIDY